MFSNLLKSTAKTLTTKTFAPFQRRSFAAATETVHENLTLTFAAPHSTIIKQQAVESITVPGKSHALD